MIRIALAQINTTVGDLKGNCEKVLEWTERAAGKGADLIAFPELTVSGYSPEDLLLRPRFVSDCRAAVDKLASLSGDIAMAVGFPHMTDEGLFNGAAILQGGEIQGIYHKVLLPNYGVFDEKRYFKPGERGGVIEIGGIRLGFHICEDSWEADRLPTVCSAVASVDAVLNLSASPYAVGKFDDRRRILSRVARQSRAPVLYVNLIGGQDEIVFDGGSVVVSAEGEIVSRCGRFEEAMLYWDVTAVDRPDGPAEDHSKAAGIVCNFDVIRIRRSDEEGSAESEEAPPAPCPPVCEAVEGEIYRALVLGTGDYLRKNGFQKAVIGLSGGIDSALVAAIAQDALGAENVVGVTMPSRFTSEETRNDARVLADNLEIEFLEIPIGTIDRTIRDALADSFEGADENVTEENIQARIRGTLLMSLSNKFGWIVLNTGNKSESAVGYCTLYGDMVGGLAVIKDVPKTIVWRLAKWRNYDAKKPLIPESTIERPPTAELRAGQKDSDTLPDYEKLDAILEAFIERDKSEEEVIERFGEEEMIRKILRMVRSAEYKRRQAPPGIKITPRAFGKDRRVPITNRYSPDRRF